LARTAYGKYFSKKTLNNNKLAAFSINHLIFVQ
jgi:hypothetical protein